MYVTDLRHFLDLPQDAAAGGLRMAEHLVNVVRAASSAQGGAMWVSALPCRRRPGRQPCTGHIAVLRVEVPASIEWRCTACGDEGVISGWKGTYADLRTTAGERAEAAREAGLRAAEAEAAEARAARAGTGEVPAAEDGAAEVFAAGTGEAEGGAPGTGEGEAGAAGTGAAEVVVTEEVAAALRELRLLDTPCERLVYQARFVEGAVVLSTSEEELDELLGFVAAEANHEPDRRRQRRLDMAFTALSEALDALSR